MTKLIHAAVVLLLAYGLSACEPRHYGIKWLP